MKKFLNKSVFLALLTAMLLTVSAFAGELTEGYVSVNALRLRAEPSTEAATITYLNSGNLVQILDDLGEWYKVSYGDFTGYVFASYVVSQDSQTASAESLAESVAGKMGAVVGNDVNFRSGPSTDADVLSMFSEGDQVTIVSIIDGWCKVDYSGQEGYINANYLAVDGLPLVEPKGIVTGNAVNVRSIPSTDGDIVTRVSTGVTVDLLALEDDWYAVSVDGTKGYIRSDFIRIYTPGAASSVGAQAVSDAYNYLGVRYSYGGASPKGFDCSGFTMYIYGLQGYSLPHSATSQWNSTGTYVERSDLQPGDLVLFCDPSMSNGKACSHVGIYIGDNQFIHASSSSTGYVKVSSLGEAYYSNYYVGAKRVA